MALVVRSTRSQASWGRRIRIRRSSQLLKVGVLVVAVEVGVLHPQQRMMRRIRRRAQVQVAPLACIMSIIASLQRYYIGSSESFSYIAFAETCCRYRVGGFMSSCCYRRTREETHSQQGLPQSSSASSWMWTQRGLTLSRPIRSICISTVQDML